MNIPEYIVSTGIAGNGPVTYATYVRKPNGSLRRVCSPMLPLRTTKHEAQADLLAWLRARAARATSADYPVYLEQIECLKEGRR